MSFILNYVDLLKKEIDDLIERERKVDELIDDFVKFASSNQLFRNPDEFYFKLYSVQSLLGDYISFLLRLESKSSSQSELEFPLIEKVPSQTKQSRLSKFLKKLRKRIPVELKAKGPVKTPTIEYGRKLLERIDHLLSEYRNALYLIKYQDTSDSSERLEYLKLMYQSYITDLASDIRSFVKAAIQLRKSEVERTLESIMKSFVKG
ncbi:hypothetical protein DRH29_04385 [candidate division Kazan bacterium]|uniref:Uncharacterized protein n=1 Tax=candidate division Kazan bacterium TaxID=2202143 RepID=A0A420ZBT9_UNCK3|nr:MAG: hypothetical protein DRH29_04385 [candidate division Kazan bacterium]